jgi:hypothetical protein
MQIFMTGKGNNLVILNPKTVYPSPSVMCKIAKMARWSSIIKHVWFIFCLFLLSSSSLGLFIARHQPKLGGLSSTITAVTAPHAIPLIQALTSPSLAR